MQGRQSVGEAVEMHPGGLKKANAFGLNDMYGNAQEWVEDAFHVTYEGAPAERTAWGLAGERVTAGRRIVRGGSVENNPDELRSDSRTGGLRNKPYDQVGFRLARSLTR
jgi:formylglycine-generating enzyme required for sulfatase activity